MKQNLLFSFEDLATAKDKAAKAATKYFKQAGATPVSVEADPKTMRTSGVSYREISFAFGDSQTVKMRVKSTGDVYQVLVNGGVVPIKNQDDQVKAIAEIVAHMDKGRSSFQAKLAKAAVKPPPGIKTAAPKLMESLAQQRDALKDAIAAIDVEIAKVRGVEPAPT